MGDDPPSLHTGGPSPTQELIPLAAGFCNRYVKINWHGRRVGLSSLFLVEEPAMGKFLDADSVHHGMFTPEEIDILNFVTKTVTLRLQLTTQDEVENVATSAISLYSSGITDPDLLLQEILSRFGEPIEPSAVVHLNDREQTPAGTH
jgi:hypothetical protein